MKIFRITIEKMVINYGGREWEGNYVYLGTADDLTNAIRKCRTKANKEFNYQYRITKIELLGEKEF